MKVLSGEASRNAEKEHQADFHNQTWFAQRRSGGIRMHPDKIKMLNGGEVSERVTRKGEDEELPPFAFGAFDFQVGSGTFVSLLILWTVFESVSRTRFVELTTLEHGWCATTDKLAILGDGIPVLNLLESSALNPKRNQQLSFQSMFETFNVPVTYVVAHNLKQQTVKKKTMSCPMNKLSLLDERFRCIKILFQPSITGLDADEEVQPCSQLNKELRAKAHSSMRITVDAPRGLERGIVPCFSPKLPKGRLAGNDMMTENVLLNGQKKRLHYGAISDKAVAGVFRFTINLCIACRQFVAATPNLNVWPLDYQITRITTFKS
ncbi:hypothetical protein Tco_0143649 [Tanacetum coccineum]